MSFRKGDTISVQYVGTLEDGSIFSQTEGSEVVTFRIGANELLPAFENAVIGKKSKDVISITIDPDDAYGIRDEELVLSFDRTMFDETSPLEEGMSITMDMEDGEELEVFIVAIEEKSIRIDGNHPLSDQKLFFTITIQ